MNNIGQLIEMLHEMRHSELKNYIAPGLSSSLVGSPAKGHVRMFIAERDTREFWVTPHSHRFDFACVVLQGRVENYLFQHESNWHSVPDQGPRQLYLRTVLHGKHQDGYSDGLRSSEPEGWRIKTQRFCVGDVYAMRHDEIHSIRFYDEAMVLFFEGPEITDRVHILEPWVDGQRVPTFKVEPWMFKRSL